MPDCDKLIQMLGLAPHPEGGHFVQIHKSALSVTPADGRGARSALTVIHYLLTEGQVSRWHRVASDEVWHYGKGSPLELLVAPPEGGPVRSVVLGPPPGVDASGVQVCAQATHDAPRMHANPPVPVHVVPAGWWQAARPLGSYGLVACTVGPGFEYDDFALLADVPPSERPVLTPPELLARFL